MKVDEFDNTIIDASFVLNFLLPDEELDLTLEVFEEFRKGTLRLYAPTILPFEVVNGLKSAVKRKRVTEKEAKVFTVKFLSLDIILADVDFSSVLSLALEENLSVYDASYVFLAKNENLPLLTLDTKLQKLTEKKSLS